MRHRPSHLRVLHVIAGLDPSDGGPPTAAIQTALALQGEGVLNEFAYVDNPHISEGAATNARMLEQAQIVVHRFSTSPRLSRAARLWGVSGGAMLWLLRSARRFDVLHMNGAWSLTTLGGLVAARLWRRTAVLSTHESLTDFDRAKSGALKRIVKGLLRAVYLRTFDVIVVSSRLELSDSGDPHGRRTVVVPHAVLTQVPAGGTTSRSDKLVVGFLGRLHPKKNLDVVIRAIAAAGPEVELIVAGEGAELDQLQLCAHECGVHDRVTWLGFVDPASRSEFLGSIAVLAMPSAYECFGLAAAEAIAAGVPVIVSPRVGVSEVVARHACGVVVDPEPAALAEVLVQLSADRERLREYARATTAVIDREFSREEHGRRMHEAYLCSVARKHRLTPRAAATAPQPKLNGLSKRYRPRRNDLLRSWRERLKERQ